MLDPILLSTFNYIKPKHLPQQDEKPQPHVGVKGWATPEEFKQTLPDKAEID